MRRTPSGPASALAPIVLRYGLTVVYLWFGISQLLDPPTWVGWVPAWITGLGLPGQTVIVANGLFELIFALLLGLGLFTRVASGLLLAHIVVITVEVGFNAVGVRDFGLLVGTLSIFLHGPDLLSLDRILRRGRG
jgi:uncharacterized membrane protein YphA (DoxX/SURF4 family)